jgi:hypothetical protein
VKRRPSCAQHLIATANLVDPRAWLADVLSRVRDPRQKRICDLLPLELAHWPTPPNRTSPAAAVTGGVLTGAFDRLHACMSIGRRQPFIDTVVWTRFRVRKAHANHHTRRNASENSLFVQPNLPPHDKCCSLIVLTLWPCGSAALSRQHQRPGAGLVHVVILIFRKSPREMDLSTFDLG